MKDTFLSSNETNFETGTMRCKNSKGSNADKANRAVDNAMYTARRSKNKSTYNESIYGFFGTKHKVEQKEEVRISTYNPNNPMNGSSSWSKSEMADFKKKMKKMAK